MKGEYIFVGNENDKLTKEWGLRYGEMYTIKIPQFPPDGMFTAFIVTPKKGVVSCPYSSLKKFEDNWI